MGLSSDSQGHMSLEEPGLDALLRIWATAGCGVARSASWFRADSVGQGGGHSAGHRPRFFFKAPVVATRLVPRIGGPAVHGDSEQHAGYGHHHTRWGKAQEGQGKRRDGSSGANGNGTIAIRAAKCGSSDPRGATGVQ